MKVINCWTGGLVGYHFIICNFIRSIKQYMKALISSNYPTLWFAHTLFLHQDDLLSVKLDHKTIIHSPQTRHTFIVEVWWGLERIFYNSPLVVVVVVAGRSAGLHWSKAGIRLRTDQWTVYTGHSVTVWHYGTTTTPLLHSRVGHSHWSRFSR